MNWNKPTESEHVTSDFGPRTPVQLPNGAMSSSNHLGVDFRAAEGADVYAAGDGLVTASALSKTRGNHIRIRHGDGSETLYQHLSDRAVEVGATVTGGQVIGHAGSTGNSTGPHLHFETRNVPSGAPIDPLTWLASRGVEPWGHEAPAEPTPTPGSSHGSTVLRQGSTGDKVRELQRVLNAWYPRMRRLVVDGYYGPLTERAVRYMQGRERLTIDGIAGPQTLGRLNIR